MNRQTTKIKENRITQLMLFSFLGFGIVITLLNLLSIEPNLKNVQFYLILLVVLAFLYKPFGAFLFSKISLFFKAIFKILNKWIVRKVYKIDTKMIDQLNCLEVAQFLKPIFEKQGYETALAKGSKDKEADLIIRKGSKTYVVQAKRMNNKVGTNIINEILGAVKKYNANGAIVITNQYYTSSAKKLAKSKNVKLVDRDELTKMLKTTNKKYRFAIA